MVSSDLSCKLLMMKIIELLKEIEETIDKLKKRFIDDEFVLVFRGESMDYLKSKLTPSLFRDYCESTFFDNENKILESLADYNVTSNINCSLHKAIDAQHYVAQSRLLDVTFNMLTAIYFACLSNQDIDGKVYFIAVPKALVFSANSKYLIKQFENEISVLTKKENNFGLFKLIGYSMINERIASQDGGFIMFTGQTQYCIPSLYYESQTIKSNYKKEILMELAEFFNITDGKVFPEKSSRKNELDLMLSKRNYYDQDNAIFEFSLLLKKLIVELKFYRKSTDIDEKYKRHRRKIMRTAKDAKNYYLAKIGNDTKLITEINDLELIFNRSVKFI